jgi:predicted DNA-binding protein
MYSTVAFQIDKKDKEQIEALERKTGRPREFILRDLIKAGLRIYQAPPTKGV